MSSEGCPALLYYWMQGAGLMYLRVPLRPLQVQHGWLVRSRAAHREGACHRRSPVLRWDLRGSLKQTEGCTQPRCCAAVSTQGPHLKK